MVKQRTPSVRVRGRMGRRIGPCQRASRCLIASPTVTLKSAGGNVSHIKHNVITMLIYIERASPENRDLVCDRKIFFTETGRISG